MPLYPISGRAGGTVRLLAPAQSERGSAWPGYDDDVTSLDATITDLGLSSSHPSLQVRARDGMNWTVELGDRNQTQRAGLNDKVVAPGDQIQIQGQRASGFGDRRIRASRLTVAGRPFDMCPERCVEA